MRINVREVDNGVWGYAILLGLVSFKYSVWLSGRIDPCLQDYSASHFGLGFKDLDDGPVDLRYTVKMKNICGVSYGWIASVANLGKWSSVVLW